MSRRSINKVTFVGNLGAGPEVRFTAAGAKVANFSMETSEHWQDKKRERKERTEWHQVVLWRGLAEITGQYLKEGSKVYVEGKLQTRTWDYAKGQTHCATEIIAQTLEMFDGQSREAADLDMTYVRGADESTVLRTVGRSAADADLPF